MRGFVFIRLFMTHWNILLKRWHLEHFLKLSCLIVFFFTVFLCKYIFWKLPIVCATFGHVTVNNLIEYYKFWMFLKKILSHIFLSWNSSCVLTSYKNIQIRVSESGHATVKYFTGIVTFKMFLKTTLSHIFLSYSRFYQ